MCTAAGGRYESVLYEYGKCWKRLLRRIDRNRHRIIFIVLMVTLNFYVFAVLSVVCVFSMMITIHWIVFILAV